MRIACHTLGCKLNFAESSNLLRQLSEEGHEVVDFHEEADIYIINTCTVTATSEKKCRTAIRQAIRQNRNARVVVTGCFAQNDAKQLSQIPGVSLIVGNDRKHLLAQIIAENEGIPYPIDGTPDDDGGFADGRCSRFPLAYSSNDRTRTFFKIQDGCDYFCTYCAIPFARGRSRSATIDDTVAMARRIAATGSKEIVLTGVNTGTFGQHNGESFEELLRALDAVEGIQRYRISSIEPNLLTQGIIELVAQSPKIMPHFHIPLQAGSDKVLKAMHRRYDTQLYRQKLDDIKRLMPHACIACDLMVGFYGEGLQEFEESCRFVESLPLSYLHVFTYSERPNTAALKMEGKVPIPERKRRSDIMHRISDRKKQAFYTAEHGTQHEVLWEGDMHEGYMGGWTDNYIRVRQPFNANIVNEITPVTLSPDNIDINYIKADT